MRTFSRPPSSTEDTLVKSSVLQTSQGLSTPCQNPFPNQNLGLSSISSGGDPECGSVWCILQSQKCGLVTGSESNFMRDGTPCAQGTKQCYQGKCMSSHLLPTDGREKVPFVGMPPTQVVDPNVCGRNLCNGRGRCIEDGFCQCEPGWAGRSCGISSAPVAPLTNPTAGDGEANDRVPTGYPFPPPTPQPTLPWDASSVNHKPTVSHEKRQLVAPKGKPYLLDISRYFIDNDQGDTLVLSQQGAQPNSCKYSHISFLFTTMFLFFLVGLPAGSGLRVDSVAGILYGTPQDVDAQASPIYLTITVPKCHVDMDGRGKTNLFQVLSPCVQNHGRCVTYLLTCELEGEGFPRANGISATSAPSGLFGCELVARLREQNKYEKKRNEILRQRPFPGNSLPKARGIPPMVVFDTDKLNEDLTKYFYDPDGDLLTFRQEG